MCLPVKPYKVEREWKSHGLSCAVVMNREAGNRCGYVRVPPGHPAFGKNYDDVDVNVHGGLTFAQLEPCDEHEDGQGYWLGFDCAHFMDAAHDMSIPESELSPEAKRWREMTKILSEDNRHYWTQPEVEAECEQLAEQLAAMGTTKI